MAAARKAAATAGHDARGRFTRGNKCGQGRKVTELRRALLAAVTPDDLACVAARLLEMAKEGDLNAAALLFDRLLGKPMTAQETELYTFEYDRADYEEDDFTRSMDNRTAQIRAISLKG